LSSIAKGVVIVAPVFDYTRLLISDMAKSIEFYTGVLGYSLKMGGAEDVYSEIDTGAHILALFSHQAMMAALGNDATANTTLQGSSVVLCFAVDDVDAMCAEIEAKGVKAVTPPTNREEWGIRTAHFYDPDGNIVEINRNL
jgi:lactoylglutathione lyase